MENNEKTITATQFILDVNKYLDYIADNKEIVITKNNKNFARLTPYLTKFDNYNGIKENALNYNNDGKKVSYDKFIEIYKKSDLRMEYINGEIYVLSSPTFKHQEISGNLYTKFKEYLKDKKCKVFYSPFDIHFYKENKKTPDVMQPDLFIACDLENNINDKGRYMGIPSLVVEILSPSTCSRDIIDKLNTYMLSGVKEYWIIDPTQETIILYSFKDNEIDTFTMYKKNEIIKSIFFNGLNISNIKIF